MTLLRVFPISWLRAGAGVEADGRAHGAGDADEKFEAGPAPAGQGGGQMGQIDPGPGLDDIAGEVDLGKGVGQVQGEAGQALVGDEQVGAPAQVKDRPALGLRSSQKVGGLLNGAGGQQVLGRAADAPGGVWGQGVPAGGLGQELGQPGGEGVRVMASGFQLTISLIYVSSSKFRVG